MDTYDVPLKLLGWLIERTFDDDILRHSLGEGQALQEAHEFADKLSRAYDRKHFGADVHVTVAISEGEAIVGARIR